MRTLPEALETQGGRGGPREDGEVGPRPVPLFPPVYPELVPGSGPREAPAISPCICQAPKTPSPVCLPVRPPRSCLSAPVRSPSHWPSVPSPFLDSTGTPGSCPIVAGGDPWPRMGKGVTVLGHLFSCTEIACPLPRWHQQAWTDSGIRPFPETQAWV